MNNVTLTRTEAEEEKQIRCNATVEYYGGCNHGLSVSRCSFLFLSLSGWRPVGVFGFMLLYA